MRRRSYLRALLLASTALGLPGLAYAILPLVAIGGGALLGFWAWEGAGAVLSGPKATDPPSIEAAAAQVRTMRAAKPPASNDEVARWLSGVVDRRLQAENRWVVPGEGGMTFYDKFFTNKDERLDRWRNLRENKPLDRVLPSEAERIAALGWETGVGNCNESASVARAILKRAGEETRIFQSSAGHDFTVLGLAPGANPNDPSTWGPDARVVDGWTGRSYTPEEAAQSTWHSGGGWFGKKPTVADLTDTYDNAASQSRWEKLKGKALLRVLVSRSRDGARVPGATVIATGPSGTHTGAASARGDASLGDLAIGAYVVTVTPPAGSGLRAGSGTIALLEREDARLPVVLEDEIDGGGDDGGGGGGGGGDGGGGSDGGSGDGGRDAASGDAGARSAGSDAGAPSTKGAAKPKAPPEEEDAPPRPRAPKTGTAASGELRARYEALRAEHRRLHARCMGGDNSACNKRKVVYEAAQRLQQALGR